MLLVGWSGLWSSSVVEVSSVPEFDATEGLTKKWGRTSQDKDRVGVACSSPHGGRDWGRCLELCAKRHVRRLVDEALSRETESREHLHQSRDPR